MIILSESQGNIISVTYQFSTGRLFKNIMFQILVIPNKKNDLNIVHMKIMLGIISEDLCIDFSTCDMCVEEGSKEATRGGA